MDEARLEWLLTYADCDPAGIMYYATPFVLMERVVTGWAAARGIDPESLRRSALPIPVVRATSGDYFSVLSVLDRVRCTCAVTNLGTSSLTWSGELRRLGPDGSAAPEASFTGRLVQVYVGTDGRPVPIPPRVRSAAARAMADAGPATR